MSTYHDRFAAALAAQLPESFTVFADRHIATASLGTASLIGYPPNPADKRAAIDPVDVTRWIKSARASLGLQMHHYTPEAKAAARALLDALDAHEMNRGRR